MTRDEAIAIARKHGLPVRATALMKFGDWSYSDRVIDAILEAAAHEMELRERIAAARDALLDNDITECQSILKECLRLLDKTKAEKALEKLAEINQEFGLGYE